MSLAGSEFEIDTDANLKLDDGAPSIDWTTVAEVRKPDAPTGATDDSFGQGTKEDTPVPVIVDGSIPPNKSDLLNFGVYLETNDSGKFLHMFWHRVQEPHGTTNMDFEFNQSSILSANGVTPVRTAGDLLIQYDLAQGGANPQLFLSVWVTAGSPATLCEASNSLPCWGKRVNLTSAGAATGSINTSAIPAADADGLGNISPRTFGEASVDFDALVSSTTCVSFGSAYLKSRASDSFTAALKDFIAPAAVEVSNCGSVKVIKRDDASNLLPGADFKLVIDAPPTGGTEPGPEDVTTATCKVNGVVGPCECTTDSNGECLLTDVLQGEYWLIETAAPDGYDLASPPYQHVTVAPDATATFISVNPAQRGAIKITKLRKHAADGAGDHPHVGVNFTVNGVTKATGLDGTVCFDDLPFASYVVHEVVPANYLGEADKIVIVDNKASCDGVPYAGETVTFTNIPLSTIAVSFTSQVAGGTAATISCASEQTTLVATPADATPGSFDDTLETFVGLLPGTYTCTIVIDP